MTEEERLYQEIGERVRVARDNARFTQEELARQIGLTRTSIANIESGRQRVQVHTLYAIARVLEVAVTIFFPTVEDLDLTIDEMEDAALTRLEPDERRWVQSVLSGHAAISREAGEEGKEVALPSRPLRTARRSPSRPSDLPPDSRSEQKPKTANKRTDKQNQ